MHSKMNIQPPVCAKKPKPLTIHGDTRIDNYYWLNDRENPEVIEYLRAENAYKETILAHLKPFRERLFEEIKGRIKPDDASVPYLDNGWFYYSKYQKGDEYPVYARKKGSLEAEEMVLLDVNELAKPYDYYQVTSLSVSPDNKLLAFGEDTVSRRIYTIRFKDLTTGAFLPDQLKNTDGRAVWANDNKTVFYTVRDATLRAFKVFRHVLGTDQSEDEEVFHEADETFSCYVYKSKSRQFIIIGSHQTVSTEYRVLPADDPTGTWQVIQPRERELEYSIYHFEDKWIIRTNLEAQNFRLMETPLHATTKENWKEIIPHRTDALIEDVEVFKDYLVLEERTDGLRKVRVMPWAGGDYYIDFPEETYAAYTLVNREFDTEVLRIGYSSLVTPLSEYDFNMKTHTRTLLKQQEVLSGFDAQNYQSERLWAPARDGVNVPVSLVYRKGFERNGQAPLLLYGYGAYGICVDPVFSPARLSLLDRGFVFAIAHIRGGEEMGRNWYDSGRLLNKKNTFYDFIDCADFLVEKKYTRPDRLMAMGGSAGGLLMGAVVNMRPDLWKGVIAAVPFVDVLTTMLDESIPLTTGEFDEWGNPKDKVFYDYIKSYSPYDNVGKKAYPALLVTTGLHDSQVQYWEPAKWVAKLRELKTDTNPLLLHTNMEAGHGGQSGRFRRYHETVMEYAFLLDLVERLD